MAAHTDSAAPANEASVSSCSGPHESALQARGAGQPRRRGRTQQAGRARSASRVPPVQQPCAGRDRCQDPGHARARAARRARSCAARRYLLEILLELAVKVDRLEPSKDRRHRTLPGKVLLPQSAERACMRARPPGVSAGAAGSGASRGARRAHSCAAACARRGRGSAAGESTALSSDQPRALARGAPLPAALHAHLLKALPPGLRHPVRHHDSSPRTVLEF